MPITQISLGLKSNTARYGHAGAARLINGYAEQVGDEGKTPWNVHAVDGLTTFATLADAGAIRCMLALTDAELYPVAGRLLYRVDGGGTATVLGAIASDGMVTMARNREAPNPTIAIVCDGLVYYCRGGVLTQNEDPDLPPPISVTHLDGYFSFLTQDGSHYASELDNGDVTALSYASAESNPDRGVRNWTRGRDLCLGGERSLEFWQNVGETPYPFGRTTAIDVGVLAAESVADIDQTSAFVAHDGTVRMLQGYQAQRISNHAVERFVTDEPDPTALKATSWFRNGHTFYALSGTLGTWVYDTATGYWHERKSYADARWIGSKAIQFGRRIVVGDYRSGTLYTLSSTAYDEAGEPLIMTVQTPPVHGYPHRLRHTALYVDVVPGVGIATGATQISNPVLMVDYSDDGGASWSMQRFAPIGAEGDRLRRVRLNRLGVSRARTYRLSISAAVARSILSVSADITTWYG